MQSVGIVPAVAARVVEVNVFGSDGRSYQTDDDVYRFGYMALSGSPYLYGDDTDGWIGREIVLTSEFVEFQGKTVKGLRVKPPAQRGDGKTEHVVEQRKGYSLSSMRQKDPLEEALGDEPPGF